MDQVGQEWPRLGLCSLEIEAKEQQVAEAKTELQEAWADYNILTAGPPAPLQPESG